MKTPPRIPQIDPERPGARPPRRRLLLAFALATPLCAQQASASPSLDDTRTALGKWIETQQLIAKERKDWLRPELDKVRGDFLAALCAR